MRRLSTKAMATDPPHVYRMNVHWGEMDAFGHVNNVSYARYFESARIHYLMGSDWMGPDGKLQRFGPILRDLSIRYRVPLVFPASLVLYSRMLSVESDRCVLATVFTLAGTEKAVADGKCQIVSYDYQARAPCPIPKAVLDHVHEVDGEGVMWANARAH